jgi:hypothetical protein
VSLCRPRTYLFSSRAKFFSECLLLMLVLHPLVLSPPTPNELCCSHLGSVCPSFVRWNDPAPNQLQIKSLLSVNIAPLAVVFTSWPQQPSPTPLLLQSPLECPNQPTGPGCVFVKPAGLKDRFSTACACQISYDLLLDSMDMNTDVFMDVSRMSNVRALMFSQVNTASALPTGPSKGKVFPADRSTSTFALLGGHQRESLPRCCCDLFTPTWKAPAFRTDRPFH